MLFPWESDEEEAVALRPLARRGPNVLASLKPDSAAVTETLRALDREREVVEAHTDDVQEVPRDQDMRPLKVAKCMPAADRLSEVRRRVMTCWMIIILINLCSSQICRQKLTRRADSRC